MNVTPEERKRLRQLLLWPLMVEPLTTWLGTVLITIGVVGGVIRLSMTHYEWAFLNFVFAYLTFAVRVAARGKEEL